MYIYIFYKSEQSDINPSAENQDRVKIISIERVFSLATFTNINESVVAC